MPSVKRDRLLSDLERERLENRDTLNKHTRATNDVRVKKKLDAWLSGLDDAELIIRLLPKDQLKQVLKDNHAYELLWLADAIMDLKEFYPIEGDLAHPEDWKTIIPPTSSVSSILGQNDNAVKKTATDKDITRAWILDTFLLYLNKHYHAKNSPIPEASIYLPYYDMQDLQDKVDQAKLKGIQRIEEANKKARRSD